MHDLTIQSTDYGSDDKSWLGSAHGFDAMPTVTLDADLFTATFADGHVPFGVTLGKVTATGLYGPYGGRVNEVQQFDLGAASAGTFTITFDGEATAAIGYNATAAAVQSALEALSNVDPGDIVASGGPLPGTAVVLTFGGQYAGRNVPEITITPSGLTGGTVTISTTTQGGSAVADGRQTLVGHLGETRQIKAGARVPAPILRHGAVIEANLPANHGLDAAGKADVAGRIDYR